MSVYKRFVSYIFSYENGIKKENVGYARIENYNEQCRINIYMKLDIKREQKASVYLFYREKEKMQGIFMKEMKIKDGVGNCKLIVENEQLGDCCCSFEDIGGIIIYVTANRFWGTEWDDKPIYKFEPPKMLLEEQEKVLEIEDRKETKIEAKKIEAKQIEEAEIKVEAKKEEIKSKPEEPMLQVAVLRGKREMNGYDCEDREEKNVCLEKTWNCGADEKREDCFKSYTKIYPFYEQDKECIGIGPQDLTKISPILEMWKNNDFLLHGYGRFRHILLLRKKDGTQYFIGVPGMYRTSEQQLASKYGFSMFIPMKKREAQYGDFGYWCAMVKME